MCNHTPYTNTSSYITEQTKEAHYQCQSLICSAHSRDGGKRR
ncbi:MULTISPECIES: hypothetical protein [Serratia]|nr:MULTISPECIES: hypothetical protein [Serratia]